MTHHTAAIEFKFEGEGSKAGTFSGYGAVFGNVDSYGDVIAQGAFKETLRAWEDKGKYPPMLLQHGGGFLGGADDLLPIGKWNRMEENSRGLKVEGELFAIGTERGQYIYEGLKSGVLDGLSIGYKAKEFVLGTKPTEPRRTLKSVELMELSVVTFPANDRARVGGVKSNFDPREMEIALRDAGLSRSDAVKAVAHFRSVVLRDAGMSEQTPRDEVGAGQLAEIIRRNTETISPKEVIQMEMSEIKSLLDKQGEAFTAFKETHEELKKNDALTAEKLTRVETALDGFVEAKSKIEAALASEKKEREELEMKFNRMGLSGNMSEEAKRQAVEVKDFNTLLGTLAAEQKRAFAPLSNEQYGEYKAAFNSFMRRNDRQLTPDEVKTLSVGSDPDGGYFVTPDVTGRIVRKVYETSPIRQVASQQTISTDKLEGIEDLGEAGAGYAGETAQGSDTTTPQVGKWSINVYWIDTEPKATQQLLDDAAVDIESWLSGKVGDKFARFENAEFVAGATAKIRGLTSYTTAADSGSGVTWGTFGHVATTSSGAFPTSNPADKIHDLIGTLKDAYLPQARFMTRRSVVTLIRKFKDGMGNYLWQPSFVAGVPETIMGYPVLRAEDMPAVGADSLSLAFGDFGAAYQIVDRQGIRVLRDPYTSKPYIKFYTTKRTGGGAVNFEAVKFLKFGTS